MGTYAKKKFVDGVVEQDLHFIGKLRSDPDLRFLYQGPQKQGRGAKKRYAGKFDLSQLPSFRFHGQLEDQVFVYSQIMNHKSLKRTILVVCLLDWRDPKKHKHCFFFVGDALRLPVFNHSFDLAMLIDTSHHLSDDAFCQVLLELRRVSKKYIVVSDPIVFDKQSFLSSFFYRLDRGGRFRTMEEMKNIFKRINHLRLIEVSSFKTFPGLYLHTTFVLQT